MAIILLILGTVFLLLGINVYFNYLEQKERLRRWNGLLEHLKNKR